MRTKLFTLASLLILASMVLTACGPQATAAPSTPQVIVQTQIVAGTPQEVVVTATPAPTQATTYASKDPTTYVNEEFGEPDTLDPAFDYETSGSEVIQNVYDFLVFYKRQSVAPADLVPMLATEVPTQANGGISADGKTYTFKIRTGVKFHNGDTMKPSDVAFSLQRGILQGGTASPQWLMVQPILGAQYTDVVDVIDSKLEDDAASLQKADPAKLKAVCTQVTDAIKADNTANTVTFTLAQPWGPFLITLAGSWAAVEDQAWVTKNGGWDGSCDTWQKFYGVNSEALNKGPLGSGENGTGPYMLDHWTAGQEIGLKSNDNYWLQQPLWDGGPSGAPKLKTVLIKNVSDFATRYASLQAGDADEIQAGSRQNWPQMDQMVGEVCDQATGQCKPSSTPDQPLRKWVNIPTIARTDIFMNFGINTTGGNSYIGSGKLDGNGITPDFFSDVNVRQAMEYCFNWPAYIQQVFLGEGKQDPTMFLPGEPGYSDSAPHYSYDLDKCTAAFKASTLKGDGGKSLWDTGFRFTITYNTGNDARQTMAQMLAQAVNKVNNKFIIEVTGMPWAAFLRAQRAQTLPMFVVGWQEDIPDPQDWVIPYAAPASTYSKPQNLPKEITDKLAPFITQGAQETDPTKRAAIYAQFDQAYYDAAPAILGAVGFDRQYQNRWVSTNWYRNPFYGLDYYYAMSKS